MLDEKAKKILETIKSDGGESKQKELRFRTETKSSKNLLRVNGDKKRMIQPQNGGSLKQSKEENSEEVDDVPSLLSVEETQGSDVYFAHLQVMRKEFLS